MMMMGEGSHQNPMVQVPPWPVFEDHAAGVAYGLPGSGELSPYGLGEAALAALQRYLPSNEYEEGSEGAGEGAVDAYSCDEFRMYEFKVRRCPRGRSHDWTECPYAHPGEKARRRDPRRYHYSGTACPDFRKGSCKRGDACEFAHGVFECWLHPARYRTQPCKDGTACRRRVCFFAHTPEQLRVLPNSTPQHSPKAQPDSYDGSPLRHHHPHHPASLEAFFPKTLFTSSPTSTLTSPPSSPPSESPPMSPSATTGLRRASMPTGSAMNEVLVSLRQMQLSKAKSAPTSWGFQLGCGGFVSPRGAGVRAGAFSSLPTTPMRGSAAVGGGPGWLDRWESTEEEEPVEMVESGSALRAKMFEKLSKEGGLDWPEARGGVAAPCAPDVGWISELK